MFSLHENYDRQGIDDLCKLTPERLASVLKWEPDKNNKTFVTEKERRQECEFMLAYVSAVKRNNYKLTVTYAPAAGNDQGRLFARGIACGKSLQNVYYQVRDFIKHKSYTDYDMKNAHPTILLYLIQKYYPDYSAPLLEEYINHRADIMKTHNITKIDVIKTINSDVCYFDNHFLKSLHKELSEFKYFMFKNEEFQHLRPGTWHQNQQSSVLNKLMCIEERTILEAVFKHFPFQVNCFDGFQTDNTNISIDALNEITKKWSIKWDIKPPSPLIMPDIPDNTVNNPYDYNNVKEKFERNNFIVLKPLSYIERSGDGRYDEGELATRNYQHCCQRYAHVFYERDMVVNKTLIKKKFNFVREWVNDENRREYEKLDFIPPPNTCPPEVFNLYSGFEYEKWKETPRDPKVLLDHIRYLCGEDHTDECYEWLLNYLASVLLKPGDNTRVALVFQSPQGAGKNLFFDAFFKNLFGEDYYISTENADDIVGKWVRLEKKLGVVWNEAVGKDTFATNNKLKAIITDPTVRIEKKGFQPFHIKNYINLLIFSNNMTPVPISSDDRRFQVFQIKKINSPEYYTRLADALQDRGVLLGLVEVLKNRPYKKYNFSKNRVKTNYYKSLVSGNSNSMDMFIAHQLHKEIWLCNPEAIKHHEEFYEQRANWFPQKEVYYQYQEYCEKKNWKDIGRNKFYHYFKTTYSECMQFHKKNGFAYVAINTDTLLEILLHKQVLAEEEVYELKKGDPNLDVEKN